MQESFYEYQRKRMRILLVWGLGNVLGGLVGLFSRRTFWKQFWLQNLGWGGIDATIAWIGFKVQARKLKKYPNLAEIQALPEEVKKDIRNFNRLLFINTFLDAGYVVTGITTLRRGIANKREDRQGIGTSFIIQGIFLFFFDLTLTLEMRKRWKSKAN